METSLEKLQHASDAVLIRMFQRGSHRAFYVLVNRHKANLKKYAHTLLRNSELEKDAIQNTWIVVLSRLQKKIYKEKGHFKEWIQSLLYWRVKELQKTEAHFVQGMPVKEVAVTTGTPEKLLFEKRLQQMRSSYRKLNEHHRTVVKLHVEKNMSFPDIARVMHTTTSNVTSWYSRAVKRLRKLIRR